MAPAEGSFVVAEEKKPELAVKVEPKEVNDDCLGSPEKADEYLENVEIDVLESEDGDDTELAQGEDPDSTEHSSSFGDTLSGSYNEFYSSSSDMEVDSGLHGKEEEQQQTLSNGFHGLFRKKKLTDHWRNFIRPLMWRCQWIELRMNELHSQALKYDNELVKYMHKKQLQSTMVELDGSASRAVPLTCSNHKKQAMRRRRRKRNEDTVDISSYMSNHNLFSYYENKKSDVNCHSVADDIGDPVDKKNISTDVFEALNEWLTLGGKDATLERILLSIEAVQSRVLKMKVRLEDLMKTNSQELSLSQGFLGPGDLSNNVARSICGSPETNGDAMLHETPHTPPNHVPEYESDVVWPGSTVSSYGDAAEPDIIENTLDLLSAAPAPLDHHFGDLCKDSTDEVLISNQAAEEELQNFEVSHIREQSPEPVKEEVESFSCEEESTSPKVSAPEPTSDKEKDSSQQSPVLKPCYTGKKRGRKPKRKWRGGSSGNPKSGRLQKRRLTQ